MLVYIGCYTRADSLGIFVCELDPYNGQLTQVHEMSGVENPSFLALNSNRTHLYCVTEVESFEGEKGGGLVAFALEEDGKTLNRLNFQPSMGKVPCHLSLSQDENHLLAANYGNGSISLYSLNENGSLNPASHYIQHEGSSVNLERQEGVHTCT